MENVSQLDMRVLSTAMDATANGIVITDLHGVIEWANPAFSLMTGYARHELLGQHTHILKSNEHDRAFYQGLWQTILAGQTWFGAMINRRKDGTLYDEEMSITPVRDAAGQLSHFIAIKQDVTARKLAEAQLQAANEELTLRLAEISALHEQLRDMALRDPLTNLFNRRYLHAALLREVSRAQQEATHLALILIDVDHFKQVNDTVGHAAGDAILNLLAERLRSGIRTGDFACRLGGDEFLIVLPGASLAVAEQRAGVLGQAFARGQPGSASGGPAVCTLSMGVVQLRNDGETADLLLRRADHALYRAKQDGRDRIVASL